MKHSCFLSEKCLALTFWVISCPHICFLSVRSYITAPAKAFFNRRNSSLFRAILAQVLFMMSILSIIMLLKMSLVSIMNHRLMYSYNIDSRTLNLRWENSRCEVMVATVPSLQSILKAWREYDCLVLWLQIGFLLEGDDFKFVCFDILPIDISEVQVSMKLLGILASLNLSLLFESAIF